MSQRRLDTGLYRTALWLCPPGFRRTYAEDMVRDFAEAHDEASAGCGGGLWWLRLAIAADAVRTIVVQWWRTGFPVLAAISLIAALMLAEGVAMLARRARFDMPMDTTHGEILGILIVATTSVFVIAMTIVLTLWVARPIRRSRRRG